MRAGKVILSFALLAVGAAAIGQAVPSAWKALAMRAPKEIQSAVPLGEKLQSDLLNIAVAIPCRDTAGLQSFVDSVSNPRSPNYRHFIAPEEVGARFGVKSADLLKVTDYLTAYGFSIRLVAKNRLSVLADGTVAQAEAAFHTSISDFIATDAPEGTDPTRYSFTKVPSVPGSISPFIKYVEGLDDFNRPKPAFTLSPDQLRTLYTIQPSYKAGSQGQGRTVGISSFTTYGLQNIPLQYARFSLPTPPGGVGSNITVVSIAGSNGNVSSGAPGEADADMQCVLAMAPLCNLRIYDDSNRGGSGYLACLTQEADENVADIITESFGRAGATAAFWASIHTLHLSMSAQGITYMCAAGDSGATGVVSFPYPDVEPEVLTVGGTSVTTDTDGNRISEVGWNNTNTGAAGGGGWANTGDAFNILPSYQKGNGVPTNIPFRLVPDIALDSDSRCGYNIFKNGLLGNPTGGTSCASPTMAGMLADCEQQIIAGGGLAADGFGHQRFGRIQDLLYSFNGDPTVFYDVVSGVNGTLPNGLTSSATIGWDTDTGWGAFICAGFIDKVLGVPELKGLTISPTSIVGGFSSVGTVTLTAGAPTGGTSVSLASSSSAATVPSSVTVPAGATTATFTIATGSVASNTPATISATLGGTSKTATLTVTIGSLFGLSVTPANVLGGTISTGSLTLNGQAGPNGTVVTLTSNNSCAGVPATVTVPANQVTATFTINTGAVSSNTGVTITASLGSISKTAALTVEAALLAGLELSPSTLIGGSSSSATVKLNGAAGPNGAVVNLSSSSGNATLPSSVTIPAGTLSTGFMIKTTAVGTTTGATISATLGSTTQTATLTISPPALTGFSILPTAVIGGVPATGTVTLSGPAPSAGTVVSLSSANPNATVPGTVTVEGGTNTANFNIATSAVSTLAVAKITATQGGATQSASLTLNPLALNSLTVFPATVAGGNPSLGSVTLNGKAGANGVVVLLTMNKNTAVTIPASITIPNGQFGAQFPIPTSIVKTQVIASITATMGSVSETATLTVNPAAVLSVTLSPTTLAGGTPSNGVVSLTGPAPTGGLTVKLSSSNSSATVPLSVVVSAGKTGAPFVVKTKAVNATTVAAINATAGTGSASASLTINPPTILSLALKPVAVTGLTPSTGTVTLTGPAPTGGFSVSLSSSSSSVVVPASVMVVAGRTSATFAVKTIAVAAQTIVIIKASRNGQSALADLTINPPSVTGLTFLPASVVGGKSSIGSVVIGSAAPSGGLTVTLISGNGAAMVSSSVVVLAGKTSARFTVTTTAVTVQTVAKITAAVGSSSKSASLTILR